MALLLFVLTFLCTTTLAPVMYLMGRTDVETDLPTRLGVFLTPRTVAEIWGNPELLRIGLAFSTSALLILLAHELGHYIACRLYRLPSTLPYFLPVPFNFGTFGAFIKIRAPIRSKRELFDMGIAGPLAGFVMLIPFLLYGVSRSRIVPLKYPGIEGGGVFVPGRCLAMELAVRLFHGPTPEGMILQLHPLAWAAWLGLFATALNMLPLGQLDGGHILYAVAGPLQRRLALPLWIGLGLLSFLWIGWLLWTVIVLAIGLYHPPVYDERTPLDARRRLVAWLGLAVFVLTFMPVPFDILPVP